MKGKIAFVLGAAVGYVLGARAGRERYEQIKSGAEALWNTEPVQRGVGAVRGAAQDKIDELRGSVVRAGKDAFASFTGGGSGASRRSDTVSAEPVDVTDTKSANKKSSTKGSAAEGSAGPGSSTKSGDAS